MPKVQRHTGNPTGLQRLDKKYVQIFWDKESNTFSITEIDFSKLALPLNAEVILIATSRESEKRYVIGTVANLNKKPQREPLEELGEGKSITFRIIVHEPGDPKLIASCEDIKPTLQDIKEGEILPIEYRSDLGELFWKLDLDEEGDRFPELIINNSAELQLEAKMRGHDPYIRGLILPAAIKDLLVYLAHQAGSPTPDSWQDRWGVYLESKGIDVPSSDQFGELDDIIRWASKTVDILMTEFKFASKHSEISGSTQ